MQTHGFPIFFVLSIVQAGVSLNYLHTADAQSLYIADLVSHCVENALGTVDPTAAAEKQWVDLCIEQSAARRELQERCTPGYFNFEGAPPEEHELNAPFGRDALAHLDNLIAMAHDGFTSRPQSGHTDESRIGRES